MKQLQFVKKGFKPVSRTVKWLKRFSPKHRYHQMPADSSFSNQLSDTEMNINIISSGDNKVLHNAIFYKAARFLVSEEGTFWYSETPDNPGSKGWGNIMPRNCTWARLIEKESEQAFYFYNTHLNHLSERSRKKGVILLTRRIHTRTYPDAFVLTGDFNARERSAPIQYLKGQTLINTKAEGKVQNPNPLMDTFRVRYPTIVMQPPFTAIADFFSVPSLIIFSFPQPSVCMMRKLFKCGKSGATPRIIFHFFRTLIYRKHQSSKKQFKK